MIVLDTNVISELWKATPDSKVLAWMDDQAVETLFLSAITVAELNYGIATMPEGRRRSVYQERLEREVLPLFAGRVLPFDLEAARCYASLMSRARAVGKPISEADGYIAAITAVRGFMIATRDAVPFSSVDVAVIDPWSATQS